MKSNLPSQEQKNISDITNQSGAPETLYNLSEYDKSMIEKYQNQIKDGKLTIYDSLDLKSLDFIRLLNLNKLVLKQCQQIIPKLESSTIKKLEVTDCKIYSVKDFQLKNLEVLDIWNNSEYLKSNTLVWEILQFQKLKKLLLYYWKYDLSSLSQMTRLTKLGLIKCNLHSTEALRPLINLEELCLNCNEEIDILTLQYLSNLTYLSSIQCNLVKQILGCSQTIVETERIIYI
ncbi:Leucine-rich_repeat domain superfamily [Hexamita inflata]|uniref:Leucine-rich repeat domain superfamily n=1 Tax=Hexamita inflata TaxID=28002 RepID=A0AA86TH16_9EUKA|nr:Leucine-rich repeat domain superfamily [Hexamita inflata]